MCRFFAIWEPQSARTLRDRSGFTGIASTVFIGRMREVPEEWTELCMAFWRVVMLQWPDKFMSVIKQMWKVYIPCNISVGKPHAMKPPGKVDIRYIQPIMCLSETLLWGWLKSGSVYFTPRKESRYKPYKGLAGPQGQSYEWSRENSLAHVGVRTRTTHLVMCRNTGCAILMCRCEVKPLKPTGHVMHQQFNPYPANVDNMASSYQC